MTVRGDSGSTASVTPVGAAHKRRCHRAETKSADVLGRILDAGLELARLERDGHELDEAEWMALDCCDEIGGVRDVVRADDSEPLPRDPRTASEDPASLLYDF